MKNKILIPACLTVCGLAWAAKDPVIMTVNGVDVPKSEFEYLYHKNSQQQLEPQTLDEYVETFKIYKLKVADARAEGLDTLPAYLKEIAQYRNELAAPYMADSAYLDKLVDEAYSRLGEEVEVNHIMVSKMRRGGAQSTSPRQLADSLLHVLRNGGDFDDLAVRFSQDGSAKNNAGHLGYITAGRLPYNFETVAYSLAEGEISDLVESPMGYHIILGGKKRPARGEVQASHIMKMVQKGASPEQEAKAKAEIDSIYEVVVADPGKFGEIAMKLSDDKGSARQKGSLPWFGAGMMVAEFDSAAFAMKVDEISRPVRTQFGWHIIMKTGERSMADKSVFRADALKRMANPQDDRFKMIRDHQTEILAKKHNGALVDKNVALLKQQAANGIDSVFVERWSHGDMSNLDIAMIGRKPVKASVLATSVKRMKGAPADMVDELIDNALALMLNKELVAVEEEYLLANEPDYRNLYNEYCEGTLLFDISNRRAWDKAGRDTEGLRKYFDQHRSEYKWDKPRVKGYLVQAVNDSVASVVKERMHTLGADTLQATVKKEFAGQVQIDRVLAAEGTNAMVDAVMFGGKPASTSFANFSTYFLYEPRLLDAPEEMEDVKGQVTSDYQNLLMDEWVNELKSKYPVSVNKKELKKLKKN